MKRIKKTFHSFSKSSVFVGETTRHNLLDGPRAHASGRNICDSYRLEYDSKTSDWYEIDNTLSPNQFNVNYFKR